MATAGLTGTNQTIGISEERVYNGPPADQANPRVNIGISAIVVRNRADSPVVITVRIPELHGSTASVGATLPIGEKEYFRVGNGLLTQVFISGNTAKVDWYPVAATRE